MALKRIAFFLQMVALSCILGGSISHAQMAAEYPEGSWQEDVRRMLSIIDGPHTYPHIYAKRQGIPASEVEALLRSWVERGVKSSEHVLWSLGRRSLDALAFFPSPETKELLLKFGVSKDKDYRLAALMSLTRFEWPDISPEFMKIISGEDRGSWGTLMGRLFICQEYASKSQDPSISQEQRDTAVKSLRAMIAEEDNPGHIQILDQALAALDRAYCRSAERRHYLKLIRSSNYEGDRAYAEEQEKILEGK